MTQNRDLPFQRDHQLPGLPQIVVRDPLIRIRPHCDLIQIRPHPSHLLDNAPKVLVERSWDHRTFGDVRQRRIAQEWRHTTVELPRCVGQ